MVHIANWPLDLNWPFQRPMFSNRELEWRFWDHLLSCEDCRRRLRERFDNHDLEEERFWQEVQEYLRGVHPSLLRIAKRIVLESRHDLIEKPSREISEEVWEKTRSSNHHLMICSKCSATYTQLYQRLRRVHRDVREAYRKWRGLYPEEDTDW